MADLTAPQPEPPAAAKAEQPEAAVGGDAPSPFNVVASVRKDQARENLVEMAAFRECGAPPDGARLSRPADDMDCMVIDDVLSAAECAYLVAATERMGYTFWDSRPDKVTDFRNADTIELWHEELAALLWDRVSVHLSDSVHVSDDQDHPRWQRDLEGDWDPVGTNKLLLFARYRRGGHFAPHTDGYNVVDCDERSMYSIVLFLNDCVEGGGTRFYEDEQKERLVKDEAGRYTGRADLVRETVAPVAGRMVVFFHNLLHEGVPVGPEAEKYIIRSDVMYRRRDPLCKTEQDRAAFDMYQRAQELSSAGDMEEATRLFRRAFKSSETLADVYGM